jgi:hypothetical protein
VKLSALAVRLEEPFRVLICRYWHRDSKIFSERRISFTDLGREGIFSLARVESLGAFLELDASSTILLRVVFGAEFSILQDVIPLLGVIFICDPCWLNFLELRVHLAGRVSHSRGCMFFLVLRGRQRGRLLMVDLSLLVVPCIAERYITELGAAISLKPNNRTIITWVALVYQLVWAVLGIFSWLCMLGGSKFSTADILFIFERYFYLILTVIGSALIFNKNNSQS